MTKTAHSFPLLKFALLADAVASGATGLLMAAGASLLTGMLGLSATCFSTPACSCCLCPCRGLCGQPHVHQARHGVADHRAQHPLDDRQFCADREDRGHHPRHGLCRLPGRGRVRLRGCTDHGHQAAESRRPLSGCINNPKPPLPWLPSHFPAREPFFCLSKLCGGGTEKNDTVLSDQRGPVRPVR